MPTQDAQSYGFSDLRREVRNRPVGSAIIAAFASGKKLEEEDEATTAEQEFSSASEDGLDSEITTTSHKTKGCLGQGPGPYTPSDAAQKQTAVISC